MRDLLVEIFNETKEKRKYREIPKFPSVVRDLSFVVPKDINSKEIDESINKWHNKFIKGFKVFDYYPQESGNSYSYTFEFFDPEKTLTDEEINKFQKELIEHLSKKLNAELRK